jgi:hypothetical protein
VTHLILSLVFFLATWLSSLPSIVGVKREPPPLGEPKAREANLDIDDIVKGLEKAETAWRSQKSWMLRYEHAREAINFSLPIDYHPHEAMNARKGEWLYASRTPITADKQSNKVWALWRDGKYTQRILDSVFRQTKDEFLKAGSSSFLYQLWWYPNTLGIDLVSDAFPFRPEEKDGPNQYHLVRYLKANRDKFRVRKELELVDKVPCHVLEWEGRDIIWVDPSVGFGVRRRTEIQGARPGDLANEYKGFRFQERTPGIWLPDRQVSVTFTAAVGEKGSWVQKVITSTIKEARFNDLPDDFFQVPINNLKVWEMPEKKQHK